MGTVYQAAGTRLGREVALKLLRPALLEDGAAIARLEREACGELVRIGRG
jgi:hypothetical protein